MDEFLFKPKKCFDWMNFYSNINQAPNLFKRNKFKEEKKKKKKKQIEGV